MNEHINKINKENEELSLKLKFKEATSNEIRNKLEEMTNKNNLYALGLTQRVENLDKENQAIHDYISSIPSASTTPTLQDKIADFNQYNNLSDKTLWYDNFIYKVLKFLAVTLLYFKSNIKVIYTLYIH
jgi:DNA integrity scanning protein DisA with diadenylate cyclase activity